RSDLPFSKTCEWANCKLSGKTFTKRNHFVSHCRAHVEFWPYGCKDCGRAFKWAHDLKKHRDKSGHSATSAALVGENHHVLRKKKDTAIRKKGNSTSGE
ncbi:hypothetical protein BC829DRAFT_377517, partial [Chytridium lagenaria]